MRLRVAFVSLLGVVVACATTPSSLTSSSAPAVATPSASEAEAPIPTTSALSSAAVSASASASVAKFTTGLPAVDRALERTGDSCPRGMILIDGDYCTDLNRQCLKQWHDKSNNKDVCEEYDKAAKCVGTTVKKRFCIDTFAWPNVKAERPEIMNSFYQAMVKCASVGRRMCTESEWNFACEGPEMKPFPYGYKRDPHKCNGDHKWDNPDLGRVYNYDNDELVRLWKGVRNGSQPECVSDFGVPDLPGNTDDVVANDSYKKGGIYAVYDSVHTGGPWYKGVRNACRPKAYSHGEGFSYYFLGFRCCAEADGKPTDPRTPRMIESNAPFQRIERNAGFTVAEMKEKLELKSNGKCVCNEADSLCKTMCGLVLPNHAVDTQLDAPR